MLPDFIKKTYHRYLLERLLKEHSRLIRGRILDIGSKSRRYDHLFEGELIAADLIPDKELDIVKEDVTALSYESNFFDGVICLEVFEYLELKNFTRALAEIQRVLKKKGTAIITCPFYYKDHQDNIRLSRAYFSRILFNFGFRSYQLIKIGNKHTAVFDILRYSFCNKISKASEGKKLFYALSYLPRLVLKLWLIKIFHLERIQDDFYSGLFILLKK